MHMHKIISCKTLIVLALGAIFLNACSGGKSGGKSSVTGWKYDDKKMGNYHVSKMKYPKAGPGLVFVQGGTFVMGAKDEDVMGDWNNVPKRITIPSFFIDETEVANVHYREYIIGWGIHLAMIQLLWQKLYPTLFAGVRSWPIMNLM